MGSPQPSSQPSHVRVAELGGPGTPRASLFSPGLVMRETGIQWQGFCQTPPGVLNDALLRSGGRALKVMEGQRSRGLKMIRGLWRQWTEKSRWEIKKWAR